MHVGLHLLDREGVRGPDDDLGIEEDAPLAGLWMRSPGLFDQRAIDNVGHGADRLLDHLEIVRQAAIERDAGPLDDRRQHDVVVLVRRCVGETQRQLLAQPPDEILVGGDDALIVDLSPGARQDRLADQGIESDIEGRLAEVAMTGGR